MYFVVLFLFICSASSFPQYWIEIDNNEINVFSLSDDQPDKYWSSLSGYSSNNTITNRVEITTSQIEDIGISSEDNNSIIVEYQNSYVRFENVSSLAISTDSMEDYKKIQMSLIRTKIQLTILENISKDKKFEEYAIGDDQKVFLSYSNPENNEHFATRAPCPATPVILNSFFCNFMCTGDIILELTNTVDFTGCTLQTTGSITIRSISPSGVDLILRFSGIVANDNIQIDVPGIQFQNSYIQTSNLINITGEIIIFDDVVVNTLDAIILNSNSYVRVQLGKLVGSVVNITGNNADTLHPAVAFDVLQLTTETLNIYGFSSDKNSSAVFLIHYDYGVTNVNIYAETNSAPFALQSYSNNMIRNFNYTSFSTAPSDSRPSVGGILFLGTPEIEGTFSVSSTFLLPSGDIGIGSAIIFEDDVAFSASSNGIIQAESNSNGIQFFGQVTVKGNVNLNAHGNANGIIFNKPVAIVGVLEVNGTVDNSVNSYDFATGISIFDSVLAQISGNAVFTGSSYGSKVGIGVYITGIVTNTVTIDKSLIIEGNYFNETANPQNCSGIYFDSSQIFSPLASYTEIKSNINNPICKGINFEDVPDISNLTITSNVNVSHVNGTYGILFNNTNSPIMNVLSNIVNVSIESNQCMFDNIQNSYGIFLSSSVVNADSNFGVHINNCTNNFVGFYHDSNTDLFQTLKGIIAVDIYDDFYDSYGIQLTDSKFNTSDMTYQVYFYKEQIMNSYGINFANCEFFIRQNMIIQGDTDLNISNCSFSSPSATTGRLFVDVSRFSPDVTGLSITNTTINFFRVDIQYNGNNTSLLIDNSIISSGVISFVVNSERVIGGFINNTIFYSSNFLVSCSSQNASGLLMQNPLFFPLSSPSQFTISGSNFYAKENDIFGLKILSDTRLFVTNLRLTGISNSNMEYSNFTSHGLYISAPFVTENLGYFNGISNTDSIGSYGIYFGKTVELYNITTCISIQCGISGTSSYSAIHFEKKIIMKNVTSQFNIIATISESSFYGQAIGINFKGQMNFTDVFFFIDAILHRPSRADLIGINIEGSNLYFENIPRSWFYASLRYCNNCIGINIDVGEFYINNPDDSDRLRIVGVAENCTNEITVQIKAPEIKLVDFECATFINEDTQNHSTCNIETQRFENCHFQSSIYDQNLSEDGSITANLNGINFYSNSNIDFVSSILTISYPQFTNSNTSNSLIFIESPNITIDSCDFQTAIQSDVTVNNLQGITLQSDNLFLNNSKLVSHNQNLGSNGEQIAVFLNTNRIEIFGENVQIAGLVAFSTNVLTSGNLTGSIYPRNGYGVKIKPYCIFTSDYNFLLVAQSYYGIYFDHTQFNITGQLQAVAFGDYGVLLHNTNGFIDILDAGGLGQEHGLIISNNRTDSETLSVRFATLFGAVANLSAAYDENNNNLFVEDRNGILFSSSALELIPSSNCSIYFASTLLGEYQGPIPLQVQINSDNDTIQLHNCSFKSEMDVQLNGSIHFEGLNNSYVEFQKNIETNASIHFHNSGEIHFWEGINSNSTIEFTSPISSIYLCGEINSTQTFTTNENSTMYLNCLNFNANFGFANGTDVIFNINSLLLPKIEHYDQSNLTESLIINNASGIIFQNTIGNANPIFSLQIGGDNSRILFIQDSCSLIHTQNGQYYNILNVEVNTPYLTFIDDFRIYFNCIMNYYSVNEINIQGNSQLEYNSRVIPFDNENLANWNLNGGNDHLINGEIQCLVNVNSQDISISGYATLSNLTINSLGCVINVPIEGDAGSSVSAKQRNLLPSSFHIGKLKVVENAIAMFSIGSCEEYSFMEIFEFDLSSTGTLLISQPISIIYSSNYNCSTNVIYSKQNELANSNRILQSSCSNNYLSQSNTEFCSNSEGSIVSTINTYQPDPTYEYIKLARDLPPIVNNSFCSTDCIERFDCVCCSTIFSDPDNDPLSLNVLDSGSLFCYLDNYDICCVEDDIDHFTSITVTVEVSDEFNPPIIERIPFIFSLVPLSASPSFTSTPTFSPTPSFTQTNSPTPSETFVFRDFTASNSISVTKTKSASITSSISQSNFPQSSTYYENENPSINAISPSFNPSMIIGPSSSLSNTPSSSTSHSASKTPSINNLSNQNIFTETISNSGSQNILIRTPDGIVLGYIEIPENTFAFGSSVTVSYLLADQHTSNTIFHEKDLGDIVLDINAYDTNGNQITNFDKDVTICLIQDSGLDDVS